MDIHVLHVSVVLYCSRFVTSKRLFVVEGL
jgi:hypothetical protein